MLCSRISEGEMFIFAFSVFYFNHSVCGFTEVLKILNNTKNEIKTISYPIIFKYSILETRVSIFLSIFMGTCLYFSVVSMTLNLSLMCSLFAFAIDLNSVKVTDVSGCLGHHQIYPDVLTLHSLWISK